MSKANRIWSQRSEAITLLAHDTSLTLANNGQAVVIIARLFNSTADSIVADATAERTRNAGAIEAARAASVEAARKLLADEEARAAAALTASTPPEPVVTASTPTTDKPAHARR